MAVTVVDDMTLVNAADAVLGWAAIGPAFTGGLLVTDNKVQGTGSINYLQDTTGLGGGKFDTGAATTNIRGKHLYMWASLAGNFATKAANGLRLRVSTDLAGTTNFGEWTVAGQDTTRYTRVRFFILAADSHAPFTFVTGAAPALTAVRVFAVITDMLTAPAGDANIFWTDAVKFGTGIDVRGGTGADPGKSSQIAADDETAGRGVFKLVGGIYYVLGRLTFGATTLATEFVDKNEVWIFEDMPVSATLYKLAFIGDPGVNTNVATFGTKSGTGAAAEGSSGNTVAAVGTAPFRIEAADANITVGLYGCSFLNPPTLKKDPPRAYQFATAADVFTDQTRQAGNTTVNDFSFMPATEAVGDKCVFGHEEPFSQIEVNVGTAGVGGAVAWEYWNGAAWAALTSLTDATTGFTVAGTNLVTYAIPDDWATTTLGGLGPYYYIRARVTTVYSTNPSGTQAFCVMGGRVRLEASTVETIRCTFTNMDTIRVRNGAFLKKCTITNSVAPVKSAALDLGAADPAVDTVRDLTIQNCIRGVLLRPTATATYNFRNIKFSGNTIDVRVDAPAAATVTINVLEGGTTPTTENVNGSTIVINNSVTLTVTVKDEAGAAIQSARVSVRKTSDNTEVLGGLTDVNGVVTGSFNFTVNTDVRVRVRKGSGPDPTKDYLPVDSPQTITSGGLTTVVTMTEDPINAT